MDAVTAVQDRLHFNAKKILAEQKPNQQKQEKDEFEKPPHPPERAASSTDGRGGRLASIQKRKQQDKIGCPHSAASLTKMYTTNMGIIALRIRVPIVHAILPPHEKRHCAQAEPASEFLYATTSPEEDDDFSEWEDINSNTGGEGALSSFVTLILFLGGKVHIKYG